MGPRTRQRRQQRDLTVVTLHQHLRDRRGGAEVAVDLERRMGAEKIRIRAAAARVVCVALAGGTQLIQDQLERPLAVTKPRPPAGFPGAAPAGAFVAPT